MELYNRKSDWQVVALVALSLPHHRMAFLRSEEAVSSNVT